MDFISLRRPLSLFPLLAKAVGRNETDWYLVLSDSFISNIEKHIFCFLQ